LKDVSDRLQTPIYQMNSILEFKKGTDGSLSMTDGWSDSADDLGVWSVGHDASILMPIDREPSSDVTLAFDGDGFITPKVSRQRIDVLVNGTNVGQLAYSQDDPKGWRTILVKRELFANHEGFILIQFQLPDAVSPAKLGLSVDRRDLALRIKSLVLKPVEPEH
jgi:hypothetical protein